jgi:hypothetical protein
MRVRASKGRLERDAFTTLLRYKKKRRGAIWADTMRMKIVRTNLMEKTRESPPPNPRDDAVQKKKKKGVVV